MNNYTNNNQMQGIIDNINELQLIITQLYLINDFEALVFALNDLLYYEQLVNNYN